MLLTLHAGMVRADPRENMREAYVEALRLFNELELDSALGTIEGAIVEGESGLGARDPVLASLHVMKAALLYSTEGDDAHVEIVASLQRAVGLNYYVVVPLEVRSDGLTTYLGEARAETGEAPEEAIQHEAPETQCGEDIRLEALLSVPDGGQAVLYWRRAGSGDDFTSLGMEVFSNVAEATIPADDHGDADLEYFIYAFDAGDEPVANLGTDEAPARLELGCLAGREGRDLMASREATLEDQIKERRKSGAGALPNFMFNLGFGTGGGVAKGEVEATYKQFAVLGDTAAYGYGEHACAIARWAAGNSSLPSLFELYGGDATSPTAKSYFAVYGPEGRAADLARHYNPDTCAERNEVSPGVGWSPLIVAPELQFRLSANMTLGLFGRFQVISGSKVFRDAPNLKRGLPDTPEPGTAYWDDVYTDLPQSNYRHKVPFTWAAGAKFRYYFGTDDSQMRPFAGVYGGYGHSRLRVNMQFANDRNGNSVPDGSERGYVGATQGQPCVPVWPYTHACDQSEQGAAERKMVESLRTRVDTSPRMDTVVLGPLFVGAVFGLHYRMSDHFALFAEAQIGGWFLDTDSILVDLNLGPVLAF
ncbi:MAG: hypothetical protein V3V08_14640 [Nannocystaceae bacterium]